MSQIRCPHCNQPLDARMAVCRNKKCSLHTGVMIDLDNCCDNPTVVNYSLKHSPQPIRLTTELLESIERLLWYLPNTKCLQAPTNDFVTDLAYSDKLFTYILEKMGMTENDVLWYPKSFSPGEAHWSDDKVCINCQKLILQMDASNTKTENLFRHIRNTIAHGRFNLVNGMLVGTDADSSGITAIIKLRPERLVAAIKGFTDIDLTENVIRDVFLKLGYNVKQEESVDVDGRRFRFDFIVEKRRKSYAIEIKRIGSGRFLHPEMIKGFVIAAKRQSAARVTPVLVTEREVLTIAAQAYLEENNVLILDKSRISAMIIGRDILKEIDK